ncbi:bifunctional diaminohydroxyphosphoribosylaminopyrimidine deaminase/5-amino-6-(5-phosphoribosylamino)uracil reductase RibD [Crenobacter cavernae]|uniref:Riboflavin biosynthesis protein RibD n=1 Tax=Crenobacter cavernae TaxID=2290923 RepID=A0ABY0FIP3_9NEIS|nr:bifunctional diaminohydroxyphosphoribosylaminopyrimidine deaminase/5-amino-6-(5-phosphoribosylamino)uracil reductase RibD [Crenobacter cavernae]RXZ45352.1 bifunctional diaminohydroxyphosphoribosylaminopyrimidine deaminase/5-amino-6-(5-phosphoribosylamino)uracil reductase RibD [Crenobacter cavernae]
MSFIAEDHAMMARALQLAERALFTTTPNPRVGCVIAKDGRIVGEGWHHQAGTPHAEVHALAMAGLAARGATAYVTLEPCSHHGRTPPCADALVKAGVARVVAAMGDPNPEVNGQGMKRLAEAGIETEVGLLESQARELNKGFLSRIERGRPWVTVKTASSLDGKTALLNGQSQWITGPEARRDVHALRARSCAVLTGSGTVIADDPQLTVREVETMRQPMRVVVDSALATSFDAKIYNTEVAPTWLATAVADPARHAPYLARGVHVKVLPAADGRVDLAALLSTLAEAGVGELMIEAGAGLNGALLAAGLVDELYLYYAMTLIGHHAHGLFEWSELTCLRNKQAVRLLDCRAVGADLRLICAVEAFRPAA